MRGSSRGRSSLPIHVNSRRLRLAAITSLAHQCPANSEQCLDRALLFKLLFDVVYQHISLLLDTILIFVKLAALLAPPTFEIANLFLRFQFFRECHGSDCRTTRFADLALDVTQVLLK